jgi:23S rRNA (cytosine1962-C5)-methyltransferase
MTTINPKQLKKVALHPATIKYISQGHFWVTDDSFTKKFPPDQFLIGIDSKTKKEIGLFIQDQKHKKVKARLFTKNCLDNIEFETELLKRLKLSLQKRVDLKLFKDRENILLVNGESDELPGLLVLLLKDQILIQYYALYWTKLESHLINALKVSLKEIIPEFSILDFWIQERTFDQQKSIRNLSSPSKQDHEFKLSEFGVHYNMKINAYYDYGIYTDMSAIRKSLIPFIENKKNVLNLFCYTGAYSLFALKHNAEKVTSIDLSPKYLEWLLENIKLNPNLDLSKHQSIQAPVDRALDQMINQNQKFDFILSDPPSSSSDGEKRDNAFNAYEVLLPKLLKVLSNDGTLIVFLNTHQISWNKFEEKLKSIIDQSEFKNLINIGKRFKLAEDYLPVKGFHEGDYLKGILLEFKNKKENK